MSRVVRWRNFVAIALESKIWRPKTDFKKSIAELVKEVALDGDYIVVSEKALSSALGLLYDESSIKIDPYSKVMTYLTTNLLWGLALSRVCKLSLETSLFLRKYPLTEGARHKKLALRVGGLLQALKPTSECGIDATNVPGYLVSLPLKNPFYIANDIRTYLEQELGINVRVVISDSDKCYQFKPLPKLILSCRNTGIRSSVNLGFISFLVARLFNNFFSPYATPIGFSPLNLDVTELLIVAELADRARGFGIGRTIYDIEKKLKIKATEITWDILDLFPHYPVVVVKKVRGTRRASRHL
ncbi:MAG: coenzyme F420-0:L-glutamate ligase [Candidatus Nezhaarchaeales archaeon]